MAQIQEVGKIFRPMKTFAFAMIIFFLTFIGSGYDSLGGVEIHQGAWLHQIGTSEIVEGHAAFDIYNLDFVARHPENPSKNIGGYFCSSFVVFGSSCMNLAGRDFIHVLMSCLI